MISKEFPDLDIWHVGEKCAVVPQVRNMATDNILDSARAVANSILFIGPDSVFQHVAKATDTQAIVIWGSTNPEAFGYQSHTNLVPKVSCSPCYREYSHIENGNVCGTLSINNGLKNAPHPKCHTEVTPEMVFEEVKRRLQTCVED